ncbi:hypothetical protein Tco_1194540 [Tanacetum coccineum]
MELYDLLRNNLDIFAWRPADMTGVLRSIVEHRLNIYEGCPPIRQKKRGQAPDRNKAIQEEVTKLVEAQIMRERLVGKAFKKQIRRNLEVYVDDLKCTFGTEERMFLGHIVNMKGIKACPKKAEAVIKLQSLRMLKEVQSLNGKLASLNRGGKGVPINKAIHHRTANANSTKTIRRTDNVPLRSQGNG